MPLPDARLVLAVALTLTVACAPSDPPPADAGGNTVTSDAGSNDTPDAASNDTPDAGSNDTPDAGSNDTPDAGGSTDFPSAKYTTWNKSGSRLTAKGVVDAVGNSAIGWFTDTVKAVDCEIAKATDGALRCLPFASNEVQLFGGVGGIYADSACTTPVMRLRTSCVGPALRGLNESGGRRVVQPGTAATTLFQSTTDRNGGTICLAYAAQAGMSYVTYTEVPPSEFVAFTESEHVAEGRVGLQLLTGADGSGTSYGLRDVTSDKPATLYGSNRLAAYTFSVLSFNLVPSTCGGPNDAAIGTSPGGYNPDYVEVLLASGGPNPGPQVPQLRKVLSAQNFHCRNGSTQNVSANEAVYVLEANATDPLTLPLVQPRADSRSDVVGFSHYTTESGAVVSPIPASPSIGGARIPGAQGGVLLRNGTPVVPLATFTSADAFSDAACTIPVVPEGAGAAGDTLLVADYYGCSAIPGIEGTVKGVYTVQGLSPFARPTYASDGVGGCYELGEMRYHGTSSLGAAADALFTAVPIVSLPAQ